jgi:hypothetical protein
MYQKGLGISWNKDGMTNNNKKGDIVRGDGDPRGFHWNRDS